MGRSPRSAAVRERLLKLPADVPYFSARRSGLTLMLPGAIGGEDRAMQASIRSHNSTAVPFVRATVADVMTEGLISCAPATPLRSVARLMATHRVHSVFVFDYGQEDDETTELWGLVSDLDLVAAAWADVDEQTAGESAVTPLVFVARDDNLRHAAQLMAESGVSHLAVVDPATERPVGVISTLDIARAIAD
jgi:CBS domain-containing protein